MDQHEQPPQKPAAPSLSRRVAGRAAANAGKALAKKTIAVKLAPFIAIAAVLLLGLVMLLSVVTAAQIQGAQAALCPEQTGEPVGQYSAAGVPPNLMPIYSQAAGRYKLGERGVFILAGINRVETDFGRNLSVSTAGAVGWMQFMPATWATYGVDANADGVKNPSDPADAIFGAANYLRASGAPADWYKAIFAYNHADWYVRKVEGFADRYQAQATGGTDAPGTAIASDPAPLAAGTGAAGGVDAIEYAQTRPGDVAFAVADDTGQLIVQHYANKHVPGASTTKAIVMIAVLRQHQNRALPTAVKSDIEAMILRSDNTSANRLYRRPGIDTLVHQVISDANVDISINDTGSPYLLGNTRITAGAMAALFAQLNLLLPARHAEWGRGLMENVEQGRWGLYDSGYQGPIATKSGWAVKPGYGQVVHQAASIVASGRSLGLAVLTWNQPTQQTGQETIAGVGKAILPGLSSPTGGSGTCTGAGPSNPDGPMPQRMLEVMHQTLGIQEPEAQSRFGPNPWCAYYATWVWQQAGVQIPSSGCSSDLWQWAKTHGGQVFTPSDRPQLQPGDAIAWGTGPGCPTPSVHVDLVERVLDDGSFMVIGGNVSDQVKRSGPIRLENPTGRPIWSIARAPGA